MLHEGVNYCVQHTQVRNSQWPSLIPLSFCYMRRAAAPPTPKAGVRNSRVVDARAQGKTAEEVAIPRSLRRYLNEQAVIRHEGHARYLCSMWRNDYIIVSEEGTLHIKPAGRIERGDGHLTHVRPPAQMQLQSIDIDQRPASLGIPLQNAHPERAHVSAFAWAANDWPQHLG